MRSVGSWDLIVGCVSPHSPSYCGSGSRREGPSFSEPGSMWCPSSQQHRPGCGFQACGCVVKRGAPGKPRGSFGRLHVQFWSGAPEGRSRMKPEWTHKLPQTPPHIRHLGGGFGGVLEKGREFTHFVLPSTGDIPLTFFVYRELFTWMLSAPIDRDPPPSLNE